MCVNIHIQYIRLIRTLCELEYLQHPLQPNLTRCVSPITSYKIIACKKQNSAQLALYLLISNCVMLRKCYANKTIYWNKRNTWWLDRDPKCALGTQIRIRAVREIIRIPSDPDPHFFLSILSGGYSHNWCIYRRSQIFTQNDFCVCSGRCDGKKTLTEKPVLNLSDQRL